MNTQRVSVDLSKSPTYAQMVTIGQGDSGGTTIVADVYDNGQAANLSGMTAGFCMRLPHDAGYVRDGGCTISGNAITYVVDESKCCSVSGRADECYFELLSGSRKYSTSRFRVMIVRAADTDTEAAQTWDSAFDIWKQQKDVQVDAAVGNANTAATNATTATNAAVQRVDDALEALGDITELAVPLMSADVRGGAKLGDGLQLTNGALGVRPMSVATIHQITGMGGQS